MPSAKKKTEAPLPPKFEDAMDELEGIVGDMEEAELPLDELIEKYGRGMKLVKLCEAKLNEAEKQVEVLTDEPAAETEPPPADAKDGAEDRLF
ncbi:MAG: exodeoxyribonuclease VII small subunit [Verrucomicrobiota bacterium]